MNRYETLSELIRNAMDIMPVGWWRHQCDAEGQSVLVGGKWPLSMARTHFTLVKQAEYADLHEKFNAAFDGVLGYMLDHFDEIPSLEEFAKTLGPQSILDGFGAEQLSAIPERCVTTAVLRRMAREEGMLTGLGDAKLRYYDLYRGLYEEC